MVYVVLFTLLTLFIVVVIVIGHWLRDVPLLPPQLELVQCPRCRGLGLTIGDPYGMTCPHCGRDFTRLPIP